MFFNLLPTTMRPTFDLVSWAVRNFEKLPTLPGKVADLVQQTVENGGDSIRRMGSSIVYGTPDGGQEVLGFVDQVPQQLGALEMGQQGISNTLSNLEAGQEAIGASIGGLEAGQHALGASIGGLEAGQQAIGSSLASLQSMSTVSLGVAALAPVMLGGQFFWLRTHFQRIHKRLDRLEKLIDDQTFSGFKAGLDALESGNRTGNKALTNEAFIKCNEAIHSFSSRLGDLLNEPKKRQNRELILHLTQHLSVAVCAAARCNITLGDDEGAEETLSRRCPLLIQSSRAVFDQTLEKSPGRFLTPNLTDDNGGIEFLRSIVRQAHDSEVLAGDNSLALASHSLPTFVEYLLGESPRRRLFRWDCVTTLKDELRDATVSIENTSRVISLQSMITKAKEAKTPTKDIIDRVEFCKQSATSPFVAWAI